jgi:DNA-binding Lrp family transcriptional regulator
VRDLDPTDVGLLLALADEARATTVALADRLGLSRGTVQSRLAALAQAGAFRGYDRALDPAVAGFPLVAFTTLRVQQRRLAEIVRSLSGIPQIVQAHGVTGSSDLLLQIVGRSAEDLFEIEETVLAVPGVERAETVMAMSEVIPYRLRPLLSSLLPSDVLPSDVLPSDVRPAGELPTDGRP